MVSRANVINLKELFLLAIIQNVKSILPFSMPYLVLSDKSGYATAFHIQLLLLRF